MAEWISVKDRRPETDSRVLVCYGYEHDGKLHDMRWMSVLDYYASDPRPHFQHEGYEGLTVTHWMPLPEPPKEG